MPDNVKTKVPLVVMATGYGGSGSKSKTWDKFTNELLKFGIGTFVFDFSGQGYSKGDVGQLTPLTGAKELDVAISFTRNLPSINKKKIGVIGSSFGGNVALISAARNSGIKVLALKSPVSDYCEVRRIQIGEEGIELWKKKGYYDFDFGVRSSYRFYADSASVNIYKLAHSIRIPCLIVHGDADTEVPVDQSQKLSAALGGDKKLVIIPGADHGYKEGNAADVMTRTIVEWMSERL